MYKIFIKKNQKTLHALSYFVFLLLISCNGSKQFAKIAQKQQINISPSPLEVHGGEVHLRINILLPPEMLKKNNLYEAQILFTNSKTTQGQKSFMAEIGSVKLDANELLSQKKNNSKEMEFTFLYEPDKNYGDLVVKTTQTKGKKKFETPYFVVGKGIISTSTLLQEGWQETKFLDIPKNEAFNSKDYTINFFFEQGNATLQAEQLNAYEEFFLRLLRSQKALVIESAFSLEGNEKNNQVLANQRAEALKKHLTALAQEYQLPKLVIQSRISDLKVHFQELVQDSHFSPEINQQILAIVQNSKTDSLDIKLSTQPFYPDIQKKIYPKLRYARIQLSEKNKQTYAITLEEQIQIYEQNIKINNSPTAHHNLGKIQLSLAQKEKDITKKKKLLELALYHTAIANQIEPQAENFYQEVFLYWFTNQFSKAEESLNKALRMGLKHQGLYAFKGFLLMKNAKSSRDKKYREALKYLAEAGDAPYNVFNKALTHLLVNDFDKANLLFDTLLEKQFDTMLVYYCKAIVEARKGNEENCIIYLQKVVAHSIWKNKAEIDLEFDAFRKSEKFLAIFK